MTHLYSRSVGRTSLYTLYIDDYVEALDAGTLPEALRQLGFKTFCTDGQARPPLISEADYIAGFRRHWPRVKEEYEFYRAYLNEYSHSPGHSGHELDPLPFSEDDQRAIAGLTLAHPPLTPIRSTFQQSHHHRQPSDENPRDLGKLQAVAMSAANRRPSLLVNGLPSVQEDRSAANTPTTTQAAAAAAPATTAAQSPPSGSGSGAGAGASSATVSPSRDAAKLNMLRRMRPPPFQYAWTFWHDRHVAPATNPSTGASSVADAHDYENRLTVLLENIITAKPFWEAMNRFPLRNLKLKDAVHFFKRGVRPVWEDPRNVKGGAWTFRVPKDKSEALWIEILMLAVGEQFADVIQPRECSPSLCCSPRPHFSLSPPWLLTALQHPR